MHKIILNFKKKLIVRVISLSKENLEIIKYLTDNAKYHILCYKMSYNISSHNKYLKK